jgi:uncharacterized protein YoxC
MKRMSFAFQLSLLFNFLAFVALLIVQQRKEVLENELKYINTNLEKANRDMSNITEEFTALGERMDIINEEGELRHLRWVALLDQTDAFIEEHTPHGR